MKYIICGSLDEAQFRAYDLESQGFATQIEESGHDYVVQYWELPGIYGTFSSDDLHPEDNNQYYSYINESK